MAFEVIRSGPLTTVQDTGRTGHGAEGFSVCGACDPLTYAVANIAVGNPPGTAALECTFSGPVLRFDQETVIAVCGSASPRLDGIPIPTETAVAAGTGSVLDVGPIRLVRAYIAFRGGMLLPEVMGSRSTDLRAGIGGHFGRALKAGDRITLPACDAGRTLRRLKENAKRLPPLPQTAPEGIRIIRVLPGPREDAFTEAGIHTFYGTAYTVTPDSNRMGIRLEGAAVASRKGTDILSEGMVTGSIQIPSGGKPILMLADHQTTGGYAVIATVIPPDLSTAAQLRPGDSLRFEKTDPETALRICREQASSLASLTKGMRKYDRESGSEFRPWRKLRRLVQGHG